MMLANYLNVAFRNLRHNKTYSAINLLGLTMGALFCLYILLYVQDQKSYDQYHVEADRIFRITTTLQLPGENHWRPLASCSPPVAPTMKAEFPEVESFTRVSAMPGEEENLLRAGDVSVYENKGYLVDSTFFEIFNYSLSSGNPAQALNTPFSVVISEKLALKLYNTLDAVGKSVTIGGRLAEKTFQVTGVFRQPSGKSHLQSEFFMTMNSTELGQFIRQDDTWAGNNFVYGYIRLKNDSDVQTLANKLPDLLQRHGAAQLQVSGMKKAMHLQPIREIHTSPEMRADISASTSGRFLNILLLIAGFIQLVACINFMNLSTARAARRAQEVGVRKAIGASRQALVGQFLIESMLLSTISIVLATALLPLVMPWLNRLSGTDVVLNLVGNSNIWLLTLGLTLLTGLVAGSYPALYLSGFKPMQILRGAMVGKSAGSVVFMRKSLVVAQFSIAILLILGALVVRLQLQYMVKKDIGFEARQKIVFPFKTVESQQQLELLRNELARLPEVNAAAGAAIIPGQMVFNDQFMYLDGKDMSQAVGVSFTYTDEHFLSALKIQLLAGRFFTPADTITDPAVFPLVVNETTLKKLNIPVQEAPGRVLHSQIEGRLLSMPILGVMKDYHFAALRQDLEPFALTYGRPQELSYVIADVASADMKGFLKKAAGVWQGILPGQPFEVSFLEEDVAQLYKTEQTLSGIVSGFTLVSMLISCLGLFGLATFSAEQRRKEIGVRKVLGASITGITALLARDFLRLVLIALVVASPIAYYLMTRWLKEFAYRIEIQWWMFVLAGICAVLVAGFTVSFQSIRAALENPVKSLKSE